MDESDSPNIFLKPASQSIPIIESSTAAPFSAFCGGIGYRVEGEGTLGPQQGQH